MLTWPPHADEGIVGILVAALVTSITGDMFVKRPHILKDPGRYLYMLYYIPMFIWECIKANIDVVYRVSCPEMPIRPGIVKVRTKLKSDTGLTFLANSITLTPGTMSVDIDPENGFLYIHWIYVRDKETEAATKHIVEVFEHILIKIFD
jgi:multicomponent Na+:H+ antiporter subunit E